MSKSKGNSYLGKTIDIFSDKLKSSLERPKQKIVGELKLTYKQQIKSYRILSFQVKWFEFDAERENDILKALILSKSNNYESAIDTLNSVLKDIKKRNKLIRIND